MRTVARQSAVMLWSVVITALCLVILGVTLFGLDSIIYPLQLKVEREAVLQSQGYVDGSITGLENYKLEYMRLESKIAEAGQNAAVTTAYQAQQKAILGSMCSITVKMNAETIPETIVHFLTEKGGCQ